MEKKKVTQSRSSTQYSTPPKKMQKEIIKTGHIIMQYKTTHEGSSADIGFFKLCDALPPN